MDKNGGDTVYQHAKLSNNCLNLGILCHLHITLWLLSLPNFSFFSILILLQPKHFLKNYRNELAIKIKYLSLAVAVYFFVGFFFFFFLQKSSVLFSFNLGFYFRYLEFYLFYISMFNIILDLKITVKTTEEVCRIFKIFF